MAASAILKNQKLPYLHSS